MINKLAKQIYRNLFSDFSLLSNTLEVNLNSVILLTANFVPEQYKLQMKIS